MSHQEPGRIGLSQSAHAELEFVLAHVPKGGVLLELGTYDGVSARWMSDRRPDITVLSVDPFPGRSADDGNISNWLANHNPATQYLFVGTLRQFLSMFRLAGRMVDTIFIDGDHSFEAVCNDLRAATELPGAIIMGHDYKRPGVPQPDDVCRAVTEFCERCGYGVKATVYTTFLLEFRGASQR